MYHDIKKPHHRMNRPEPKKQKENDNQIITVALIIIVIALYLLAGHYDWQVIQAGI